MYFPRICPVKLHQNHSFGILNGRSVVTPQSDIITKSCFVNRQLSSIIWQISIPLRSSIICTRCHLKNYLHVSSIQRGKKKSHWFILVYYCHQVLQQLTTLDSGVFLFAWGFCILCKDLVLSLSQAWRSPICGDLRSFTDISISF